MGIDKDTVVEVLKGIVTTQIVRSSDFISIRVRHTDKDIACAIAEEVVNSYKTYRSDIETREAEKALFELNKAVREQEDKVEGRRKVVNTISKTKGIVDGGESMLFGTSGIDENQSARTALQTFNQLEEEKIQLETQIKTLLGYESEQLIIYARQP
ncbi:MAG: hypothetical protein HC773_31730 [Scytonema sp. CRU_2_7]|nr:hypothetical protein [Scytonema sp. CRU_2_7]